MNRFFFFKVKKLETMAASLGVDIIKKNGEQIMFLH